MSNTTIAPGTLYIALLAWDAWEQAAVRATTDEEWAEVERIHAYAAAYLPPPAMTQRGAMGRVLARALSAARSGAEERVRVYTAGMALHGGLGAGGEDADV